jgi:DNA ligase-4
MEDKEEEIAANVDKYMDSYARDTNVDELNEVWLHLETSRVLH